jgi:predicted nucleic acid-binding protein
VSCVVADSGPLIMLARSALLEVLRTLVGQIVVPTTVFEECTGNIAKPGAQALIEAKTVGLIFVEADSMASAAFERLPHLGAGEIAALTLAQQRACRILMDDGLGRKVAVAHRIPVIGSAGVLLAAKERGLIAELAPLLATWESWGYFLAPALLHAVLIRAGERR